MLNYEILQHKARGLFLPVARFSLALIYIWFGLLKLLSLSPAELLAQRLFERTLFFLPFNVFYQGFAAFEIIIGLLFLFPRWTRLTGGLFILHFIATSLPLAIVPELAWSAPFVPTLIGQYIIKNLALLACVLGIMAYTPLTKTK